MVSRTPNPGHDAPPPEGGGERGGAGAGGAERPEPEVFILTREAARALDELATAEYGIPSIILMENASFHIADIALHLAPGRHAAPRIVIVCGPGNNGGDGLAAARHLHNAGADVRIVLAAPGAALTGDAAANLRIVQKMSLPILVEDAADPGGALRAAADGSPDLLIDAILGTGAREPVREPLAGIIAALDRAAKEFRVPVLSVDIPSGLDCDTGEPLGAAVHADVTVSLAGLKRGFASLAAQSYLGDVLVVDIGAPKELTARLGVPLREQELPDRFTHPAHATHPSPPSHRGHAGGQGGEDGRGAGGGDGEGPAAKRPGDD